MSTYLCACCDLLYARSKFTEKCFRYNRNNHCDSCVRLCRYTDRRGAHHYYGVKNSLYDRCLVVRYPCPSDDCKNVTRTKEKVQFMCLYRPFLLIRRLKIFDIVWDIHAQRISVPIIQFTILPTVRIIHAVRNCSEEVVPGFPHCGNHRYYCSDSKCQYLKGSCPMQIVSILVVVSICTRFPICQAQASFL